MIACLVVFAVVGLGLVAFGARLGHRAFLVGAIAPAVSTVWVLSRLGDVADGRILSEHAAWVGALDLALDLRLDALSAVMSLMVAGIGVAVLVYSTSYFASGTPDLGRLAGLLVLFAGAMVGVVQADHLLVLYTCWELTAVTSYLLIGNTHTDAAARAAALHALLVTGAGGLAMLGGFVVLGQQAGTYRISELAREVDPTGTAATVALVLVLIGAFTKSAQYPFHAWLPGAMAASTPVSAYLHSAAMVKAGVYLVARLAPVFVVVPMWRPTLLVVGLTTMIAGGLRAMRQHDLKLLLAFGTVSQLGLMMVLFGAGTPAAATAGLMLVVAHALFKAALFMVVGILDRQTGTRDIRHLPVLDGRWRSVKVTAALSGLSMAGVPLAAGFIAKESMYAALEDGPFASSSAATSTAVLVAVVGASMLTVAYTTRFYRGAFGAARRRRGASADPTGGRPRAPSWRFVAPGAGLALGTVALGVMPGVGDQLLTASLAPFGGAAEPVRLALWHGFNVALALSAVTLGGGAALVVADRWVQPALARGAAIPRGEAIYLVGLRGLGLVARRVTGFVQNGSLPVYSGVIVATAAALPASAIAASWDWPGRPAWGGLRDLPIVAMLVVAALGAATVRRRFSAVVFLGATGYAMAGLFVLYGAPDLALTQVAVETLATVVFVLVLRRLPEQFERQSTLRRRAVRLGIAALVGASVFTFALVAAGNRSAPPISDEMVARSVPDGEGRNVVNVILVDFRGLDTLGEIAVLGVASIGAVALARAGRRGPRSPGGDQPSGVSSPDAGRIVFVDVTVEVIFHAVVMASLWLLFAGHNQPGGGFVGGLLAGSAITLRYIAGGISEVRGRARFRPWTVLGTGLLLATGTAAFPLLSGGAVLDVETVAITLPVIGSAKVSSALAFDIGVYLLVVGVVLMAFEAFGDDPAEAPA